MFFFCKQKTAYEVRISDWSSDVCSSDLPSGGFEGVASDAEINLREMMHHKNTLNQIIAKHTGQPVEKINQDVERDYWLGADEAREYEIGRASGRERVGKYV